MQLHAAVQGEGRAPLRGGGSRGGGRWCAPPPPPGGAEVLKGALGAGRQERMCTSRGGPPRQEGPPGGDWVKDSHTHALPGLPQAEPSSSSRSMQQYSAPHGHGDAVPVKHLP